MSRCHAVDAGIRRRRRARYADATMRVSDAERNAVADRLAQHYGDGRLDQAELDERLGRAMSAKTQADLDGLPATCPRRGRRPRPRRRARGTPRSRPARPPPGRGGGCSRSCWPSCW